MGCGPSNGSAAAAAAVQGGRADEPSLGDLKTSKVEDDYPPPTPPKARKEEIFDIKSYFNIDRHAHKTSISQMYGTYKDLAKQITGNASSELAKTRALFAWFTSIDIKRMQQEAVELPPADSPFDYLLKIAWRMGNHAHFFCTLCRAADLRAVIVTGINKSAAYQLGKPVDQARMQAQWNAVQIDGQWRLIDVFWASTCVVGKADNEWQLLDDGEQAAGGAAGGDQDGGAEDDDDTIHRINENFFIPNPDEIINTHLPNEPKWQLLEQPWSVKNFEDRVYIRERFHQMGCCMIDSSHSSCVVKAKKGECTITFGLPDANSGYQVRHLLYKMKQQGESASNITFDNFLFFQKRQSHMEFNVKFPVAGKFKLDLYGHDPSRYEAFDLLCSYVLECDAPMKNCEPLPDLPDIGWGPGSQADDAGIQATTHKDGVVETTDGKVELRFKMNHSLSVMQNLKNNNIDEFMLQNRAMIRVEDDELVISLRLAEKGDYALKMFADDDAHLGDLTNVCNYLIKCVKDTNCDPFPRLFSGTLGAAPLCSRLGVKALSHQHGLIRTKDGKVIIDFEKADDLELFCELTHVEITSAALSKQITLTDDGCKFYIECPKAGEYGANIFARYKGQTRLYHAFTYMIISEQEEIIDLQHDKMADIPVIRIEVIENESSVDLDCQGDCMAEISRKNVTEEVNNSMVAVGNGKMQLKLTELGEYVVNLFQTSSTGELVHLCIYHVNRRQPTAEEQAKLDEEKLTPEERERRARQLELEEKYRPYRIALKAAMKSGDVNLLQTAIANYENAEVPDDGDLVKAKKQLEYMRISELLTTAMNDRHLERLKDAVERADAQQLQKQLGLQLVKAKEILEKLLRIEKIRAEIMNLDQKTVAEIRSYSKPPEQVLKVMQATFTVLGEQAIILKEWRQIQALIGKTGKLGLKRRIGDMKVESLKVETALRAEAYVTGLDVEVVKDTSTGAASFYVWFLGMLEECTSRYEQEGGQLEPLRQKYLKKAK